MFFLQELDNSFSYFIHSAFCFIFKHEAKTLHTYLIIQQMTLLVQNHMDKHHPIFSQRFAVANNIFTHITNTAAINKDI